MLIQLAKIDNLGSLKFLDMKIEKKYKEKSLKFLDMKIEKK